MGPARLEDGAVTSGQKHTFVCLEVGFIEKEEEEQEGRRAGEEEENIEKDWHNTLNVTSMHHL